MEAFALLIILASGFMFTSRYPLARFKQKRSHEWIQYLHIFVWGLLFATIAFILEPILFNNSEIKSFIDEQWIGRSFHELFSVDFFLWCILSVLFGFIFGLLLSKLPSASQKASKICSEEDSFRAKLYFASENMEAIQITLNNRKVYVGLIFSCSELEDPDAKYIKVTPILSGYRDEQSLVINFTNNYGEIYAPIVDKVVSDIDKQCVSHKYKDKNKTVITANSLAKELEPFNVVLPISCIMSLSNFEERIFKEINNNSSKSK